MAFVPNFSPTQPAGQDSVIRLSDTSTDIPVSVTARRVYLTDDEGNYVVPAGVTTSYISWALSDTSININCLNEMMALNVKVAWVDVGGAEIGSKTTLCGFPSFGESVYYSLTQSQISSNIVFDSTYYQNKLALRVELDSALQAVEVGSDITAAQAAYDRATYIINNETFFF